MPILDAVISPLCPCFREDGLLIRSEFHFSSRLEAGTDERMPSLFPWKNLDLSKKVGGNSHFGRGESWPSRLMIQSVTTLDISEITRTSDKVKEHSNMLQTDIDLKRWNYPLFAPQSRDENSAEVDGIEKLRRTRISKANKGSIPWNKGRKHSPDTIKLISERTRLAMQTPEVRKKLVNLGHAQDEETRRKIGVAVRLGWIRRREKLKLQETCLYEWQNLIAASSRKGLLGEDELLWDSYTILRKQCEQEWVLSVELRKNMSRPKGSKSDPKPAEHRRKISEAISAKWKDPGYRDRVQSGLAKFHGTPDGVERKPRKRLCGEGQARKRSPKKVQVDIAKTETAKKQIHQFRCKKSNTTLYKDPLAGTKLQMLKNIKAQRIAASEKVEAITKAKLLIAEAKKAAKALESAASSSTLAKASLTESRMLIAEAIQLIEYVDKEGASFENDNYLPEAPTELAPPAEEETDLHTRILDAVNGRKVNGVSHVSEINTESTDFSFNGFILPDVVNGDSLIPLHDDSLKTSNCFLPKEFTNSEKQSNCLKTVPNSKPYPNGSGNHAPKLQSRGLEVQSLGKEAPKRETTITKKWVRGRLIEVSEEL